MDHFQILKIKELVLKVNIHCDGCKHKVKKILRKIEGVYYVVVDAELQKVKVYGNVDSTTLINKLVKSGKYAQLWPTNDQDIPDFVNGGNDQNQIQNLVNAQKSQPLLTPRSLEDQMSFARYLKQGMDMENMGWDDTDTRLIGENGTGFVDLQGSQLGGGLQTYDDHHMPMMNMYQQTNPALPMMNMYQQTNLLPMMNMYQQNNPSSPMMNIMYQETNPLPMMMNWNVHNMNTNMHGSMENVMMHDNMYMHAFPMLHHARYARYY